LIAKLGAKEILGKIFIVSLKEW